MIINAIHLYSSNVKYAEFSLDNTDHTQPYLIQSAFGLDVDDLRPNFYALSGDTRSKYYNMSSEPREITIRIKLNPQYGSGQTPSSLRDTLYKAISSSRTSTVELRFMNGVTTVATIFGFVKRFEAPLFSSNPEVQITLKSDYFFLRAPTRTVVSLGGLSKTAPVLTDSLSTAPHGFRMQLTFTGFVGSLAIQEAGSTEWAFLIGQSFTTGDVLYFSSEENNRYLYRIRSSVTLHLLDTLNSDAVWPLMFPGTTNLSISTSSFNWNDVSYYPTYWGV